VKKDQKEILQHKNKVISQIRKAGIEGLTHKVKPEPKKEYGIWKKMKKFLGI
jgi:hypothetical protein